MILIPIEKLLDNPYQPRQTYSNIDDFAADILARKSDLPDTLGLIHTPNARLVELNDQGDMVILPPDQYPPQSEQWAVQLAEGHRRRRAFEYLASDDPDYLKMPVNLLELTDQAMDNIAWDENAKRAGINPVEEAQALARTMEDFNLTQQQLADLRGLGRSTVANKLRLLKLPDDILDAIQTGQIPEKTALAYIPALDIKPHQLDQPNRVFITDPNRVSVWGPLPTPNALRRRMLDELKPALTAAEVRRIVESLVDACNPWPCEHCGTDCKLTQFMADTAGTRYCRECWYNEITEPLYCPECHVKNFVKSADIENETPHTCSMCGQITPAHQMPRELFTPQPLPLDEAPEKQPQSLGDVLENYAVYPCHNCGSKTIIIDAEGDTVRCDTCTEAWDSIAQYHTDREQQITFAIDDDPQPTDEQRQTLANLIISTDGWQQVVTEQFACRGYNCKELFYDPAGIRAWKNVSNDYLCTTCYMDARLDGECPACGHPATIPATTIKNNFGWRCEECAAINPAPAWVGEVSGNIAAPADTATANGNGHNPNESHTAAPDGTEAITRETLNTRFLDITSQATPDQLQEINTVLDQLALNYTREIRIA